MKTTRRQAIKALAALGAAATGACGDDDDTTPGADTGADAGGDTGADAGGDGGGDGGGDAGEWTDDLEQYEYDGTPGPEDLFQHGVASGDPLADAVVIWTRVTQAGADPVDVWYEVSENVAFTQRVAVGWIVADAENDFTAKLDVVGLTAGTTYYYRFFSLGRQSLIGRTWTAPEGTVDHLRFGVCSCASWAHGYFHAYRYMAQRNDLDAVLHLGDYIYEYGTGEYGNLRPYEPENEIVTLSDYRTRYSQYRRDADLQAVHQQYPFITVWDDHESADNSWMDGASNHQGATEGPWADRLAAARRAYAEWLPYRETDNGEIYRSFRFGDLVDLFMLDTRIVGREEQDGDADVIRDPERTLLGEEQEAWLYDGLRASTATWRVLGQQVMMGQWKSRGAPNSEGGGQITNDDQWDGYQANRNRLFDVFAEDGVDNVVVLTGDIHSSWAMELAADPNNPDAYDPATGAGSLGVEFVCPGISSPGFPAGVGAALAPSYMGENPHMKWIELEKRGYIVLDVRPEAVQAAWYQMDDVVDPTTAVESLAAVWSVAAGTAHLVEDSAPADAGARPDPAPAD